MGGGRAKQANDNNINSKRCRMCSYFKLWGLGINRRERDIATTMQSPDNNIVCRSSRMDNNNKTSTSEDTSSTCSSNKAPPPPMPTRLLASSVSSSSSLSSSSAAAATSGATQQYANVAEIMSTSKKYDSNQVCFKNLNFSRVTIWIHSIGTTQPGSIYLAIQCISISVSLTFSGGYYVPSVSSLGGYKHWFAKLWVLTKFRGSCLLSLVLEWIGRRHCIFAKPSIT